MVMGCTRTLAVASTSSAIISSACIAAGASPVGLRALPALRGGRRFTSVVRADIDLSGSFAGQPADLRLPRRAFVKNCAASWLLACSAAMAAPFGSSAAQPAPQDSDASSNTVIFYNYALAFNPAKARIALEEKRIPYVEQKIDLFNGESLEPWYLKINPSASAPSLVVGNDKFTESVEIIRWADRQGAPLGGDSVDRAFVDQWLNKVDSWDGNLFAAANTPAGAALKVSTEYKIKVAEANAKKNPDMAKLYEEKISTMRKNLIENPSNESLAKENRAQLQALVDEAEARLTSNKFLAGDAYSAADVIFTPVLYRVYQLKKDGEFLDGKSNVARYYEELQQRPSYKTVFATSDSPLASAKEVVPSIGKVVVDKVTGKYNQ